MILQEFKDVWGSEFRDVWGSEFELYWLGIFSGWLELEDDHPSVATLNHLPKPIIKLQANARVILT